MLSSTGGYTRILAEAGVRHALFSASPSSLHVQVLTENRPLGPADYDQLRGTTVTAVEQHIGNLVTHTERLGRGQAGMPLTRDPAQIPPSLGSPSGRPFFMTSFLEHSRILQGRWPQVPGSRTTEGVELEAVVGQRVSNDMGYEVGDRLFITPFRSAPEERIVLNIVGVATPIDSRDEFWFGASSYFSPQAVGEILVIPFYVTEADFLQVLGRRFPTAVGDFGFNAFVDPSVITAGNVDATQESLVALEASLNKAYPRTFVFSRLGLTLREFEQDLALAQVPVYVFSSLVVIVVLYFLVLATGILGRSQADELGLLRSRGGKIIQVCSVLLLADGVLAVAAVALGPLLAWLIVKFLLLPTFGDPGGGPIEFALSVEMYWLGAVGAALALLALSISAAARARTGVEDSLATRSRPPEVSFFHRYYLDIVAVAVAGLLWWQFQERDGFLSRSLASRGLELDPTLILGPVIGLLTASLLLMRFLPWALRIAMWVCTLAGPAWSSLTLSRLARDPVIPTSLAVLLMLATTLGVFGATFQSSLSRSQNDQASYRVGGEVVLSGPRVGEVLARELQEVRGVAAATPVLRDTVSIIRGQAVTPATLVAADPQVIAQSAWFRDDFGSSDLLELTNLMQSGQVESPLGIPLPQGTGEMGVWVDTTDLAGLDLQADINVWAKLADPDGRYRNVSLGGFGGQGNPIDHGWTFFSGDLPPRTFRNNTDWALAAIFFTTSSFVTVPAGMVHIDDFTVYGDGLPNNGVLVEGFEALGSWTPLGITFGAPDETHVSPAGARSGSGGLSFSWKEAFGGEPRGVHIPPVQLPLPAIGGATFFAGQSILLRNGNASIPIRIAGVSELFPTITNLRRPYIVVDYDDYVTYRRILPSKGLDTEPREVWISLDRTVDRQEAIENIAAVLPSFTRITDRIAAAEVASRNPLAGGGWNGLTVMAMAAIGLAVAAALLLHSATAARANRVDTSVGRALGLSGGQMFMSLVAEKWLLCGIAIGAGAAIGYWPGQALVQLLVLTPSGSTPVPPLIPVVHVPLLTTVLAGLAAAVFASAAYATLLARRERLVRRSAAESIVQWLPFCVSLT